MNVNLLKTKLKKNQTTSHTHTKITPNQLKSNLKIKAGFEKKVMLSEMWLSLQIFITCLPSLSLRALVY